jgi:hypothetical protein
MGAFNIVRTTAVCPACHQHVCIPVQFKYGATWQYDYHVSDQLRWGGNDIGTPGKHCVVVDGVAEGRCPHCKYDGEWDFYIFIEQDKITRVEPANGAYNFASANRTYIVLQE